MDASELSGIDLFAGLSTEDLERLAAVMKDAEYPVGHVLAAEGDLPTRFYVILSGHVTVHRDGKHVADLGRGDFFGEVGVLSLQDRNASVIATTPVRVAEVLGWDLRQLLEAFNEIRETLIQTAVIRVPLD